MPIKPKLLWLELHYSYQMWNIWDKDWLIYLWKHNIKMHISVKFEVSNTDTSGDIDINVTKEQTGLLNEEYLQYYCYYQWTKYIDAYAC